MPKHALDGNGVHLVLDEVSRVVRVAVLQQEVFVDGPGHHACLQPAEPLKVRVVRGDSPHCHGVVEVDVLRCRFLAQTMSYVCQHATTFHCPPAPRLDRACRLRRSIISGGSNGGKSNPVTLS